MCWFPLLSGVLSRFVKVCTGWVLVNYRGVSCSLAICLLDLGVRSVFISYFRGFARFFKGYRGEMFVFVGISWLHMCIDCFLWRWQLLVVCFPGAFAPSTIENMALSSPRTTTTKL